METSTSTANLFANNSVSAFAVNGTNLVSTDLAVLAGRDATVQVGRSTAFVSREVAITAEDGVDLDAGRQLSIGTDSFVLDAYTELAATTTQLMIQANRSIEVDSVGPLRVGSASLALSANADALLAVDCDVAAELIDKAVHHGKPQPGPGARLLGGKKRLKHAIHHVAGHAGSGI